MKTIRDVADRAGVSTATVSHVLAKTRGVSPGLRKKVMRAARELNYRPNEVARSLRTKSSRTMGMIIPSITDPFFPEVVRGAEDILQQQGYTLLIGNSDDDPKKEEAYYRAFLGKRVDGVLMIISPAKCAPSFLLQSRTPQTPIVYIGRFHPDLEGDYVMLDDIGSSREAVAHLLRSGRSRIGIVTGPLALVRCAHAPRRLQPCPPRLWGGGRSGTNPRGPVHHRIGIRASQGAPRINPLAAGLVLIEPPHDHRMPARDV